jgi:predicted DNA-binding transcriptional regulator AlpA
VKEASNAAPELDHRDHGGDHELFKALAHCEGLPLRLDTPHPSGEAGSDLHSLLVSGECARAPCSNFASKFLKEPAMPHRRLRSAAAADAASRSSPRERLSRRQVLDLLPGVSPSTLWRLQKQGRFPMHHSLIGKAFFWADEIQAWIRTEMQRGPKRFSTAAEPACARGAM